MKLRFSKSFEQEYIKITKGNSLLKLRIKKQFNQLIKNPKHPSLRLHKLKSYTYWSISIDIDQ